MIQRNQATEVNARSGYNPLELMAIWNLTQEAAAIPASIIIQMALWPEKLADWAEAEGVDSSVVYNMLAGIKPYRKTRRKLAFRLGVTPEVLDALIDRDRVESDVRIPTPPTSFREWVRQVRLVKPATDPISAAAAQVTRARKAQRERAQRERDQIALSI